MSKCIITLPSMTFAQKARKALTANHLEATPVRLTAEESTQGCGWGIEVDPRQLDEALHVLDTSDIPHRRIIRR